MTPITSRIYYFRGRRTSATLINIHFYPNCLTRCTAGYVLRSENPYKNKASRSFYSASPSGRVTLFRFVTLRALSSFSILRWTAKEKSHPPSRWRRQLIFVYKSVLYWISYRISRHNKFLYLYTGYNVNFKQLNTNY